VSLLTSPRYTSFDEKTTSNDGGVMSISTAQWRHEKKKEDARSVGIEEFWAFSASRCALKESERLLEIKHGFSAHLFRAVRHTFNLEEPSLALLLNASISTLERRVREHEVLDTVASERLDRIASVSHQAEEVFENRDAAAQWMSTPNKALGGDAPILLCETEIGAKQVRRVLQALEWGGVA
jgi:putative toxin-antitoxin system antitoxin component (TIGR02293 family)